MDAERAKVEGRFLSKDIKRVEGDVIESKADDNVSPFVSVFIGFVLFLASFPILWYNERRYIGFL